MKKRKIIPFVVFLFATSVYLVGCDDAKKSIKNVSEQHEMQGTFKADCKGVPVDGLTSLSSRDELEFLGNQLKVSTVYYTDSGCRGESSVGRIVYDGEFEVERQPVENVGQDVKQAAENVANTVENSVNNESERQESAENLEEEHKKEKDDVDAGVITLNIKEVYVEPTDQTLVSLLNGISFCGKSDYAKDKKAKLTGVSGNDFCPVKQVPLDLNGKYLYHEEKKELVLSDNPMDMDRGEASPSEENSERVIPSFSLVELFSTTYKKD